MNAVSQKAKAINDEYRTVAMNHRYYACRLATAQQWSLFLDIVVAVASSGTIAAWATWEAGPGAVAWKVLAGVAALVATVKPFLRLAKDVERYSELTIGYGALYYDLKQLIEDLRTEGMLTEAIWSKYHAARQRKRDLGLKDDLVPLQRLRKRCYEEIKAEIPSTSLWWPVEEKA